MSCSCNANKAIACTVNQCAHHCDTENYCSLSQIHVGTHEANPTMDQCTDCMSFEKKSLPQAEHAAGIFAIMLTR